MGRVLFVLICFCLYLCCFSLSFVVYVWKNFAFNVQKYEKEVNDVNDVNINEVNDVNICCKCKW